MQNSPPPSSIQNFPLTHVSWLPPCCLLGSKCSLAGPQLHTHMYAIARPRARASDRYGKTALDYAVGDTRKALLATTALPAPATML